MLHLSLLGIDEVHRFLDYQDISPTDDEHDQELDKIDSISIPNGLQE
jgi:hypothetical protein